MEVRLCDSCKLVLERRKNRGLCVGGARVTMSALDVQQHGGHEDAWRTAHHQRRGRGPSLQANNEARSAGVCPVSLFCAAGLAVAIVLYGLAVWSPGTMFSFARSEVFVQAGTLASVANALSLIALGIRGAIAALPRASSWKRPKACATVPFAALLIACALAWCASFALENTQADVWFTLALFVASCLSGICLAVAFVFWLERLKDLPARQVHIALVSAAALSAVLNLPSGIAPEPVLRGLVVALFAAQAALALAASQAPGPFARKRKDRHASAAAAAALNPQACPTTVAATSNEENRAQEALETPASTPTPASEPQPSPDLRGALGDLAAVLAAAVVLTFVAPLVNTVLMVDVLELPTRFIMSAAMNLATAALLAVVWLVCKRTPSVLAVLLGFTAVLFVSILVTPALGPGANLVALALGSAGFFLVIYLVMEAGVTTAQERHLAIEATYGTVAGIVMLARVLADMLSANLLNADIAGESKMLVATFLLVYLLTCAGFALYNALTRRKRRIAPEGASAPDAQNPTAAETPAVQQGPDRSPAELVSDAHNLSQREREVLVLIMRGRNVPAIAEELVLSRNTVQTHVRHIYEQLGIHSRQELVAYVEGFSSQSSNA